MRQKISKSAVNSLKPGHSLADTNPVGFVARRLPSGTVAYGFRYRDKHSGRQRWIGLGLHGDITPDLARKKALKVAGEVRDGGQPLSASALARSRRQAASHSLDELLNNFMSRYVRPNLRSADEIGRCFDVYVRPVLGSRSIYDIRRRDVVEMLDRIEDTNGPVMCDRVLAHVRKCFNWQAARDDAFTPPIVKGMARTKPLERARKRVLDDEEIRDLHLALDELHDTAAVPKCFRSFVRALLLSGQRRAMVSEARWEEIDGRDWVIPATRNKGKVDHLVPLTDTLLELLDIKGTRGFVFSSDKGRTPFSGFSKAKAALDARLAEMRKAGGRPVMKHWTFHDLRRSARSLMARAGVPSDHAERVLGHVIPGVRGTYDRHEYADEKREALEKLSALVERILHPNEAVIRFPKRRKKR